MEPDDRLSTQLPENKLSFWSSTSSLLKKQWKAASRERITTLDSLATHVFSRQKSTVVSLLPPHHPHATDGHHNAASQHNQWVILPDSEWYFWWWLLTVLATVATAIFEPFFFAFIPVPGLAPYNSFQAVLVFILITIFSLDILINFFRAYHQPGKRKVITDLAKIRARYLKFMFWVDVLAVLPLDLIIMAGMGIQGQNDQFKRVPGMDPNTLPQHWFLNPSYLAMLKWLTLLRMYRLIELFVNKLEYNMKIGQLTVTLLRNQLYVLFLTHWAACWWYWLARINYYSTDPAEPTWFTTAPTLTIMNGTLVDDYIASWYFVTVTFGTVGYGDIHGTNSSEYVFVIVLILLNTVVAAYILGTITALVVAAEEHTKTFRRLTANLVTYTEKHTIPPALHKSMQDHLKMHLDFSERSDESVLQIYPSTIRRRVLRHLYHSKLAKVYLFRGLQRKFLDVILAMSKIETFMPKDEIITEGDFTHELCILIEGSAKVVSKDGVGIPRPSNPGLEPDDVESSSGNYILRDNGSATLSDFDTAMISGSHRYQQQPTDDHATAVSRYSYDLSRVTGHTSSNNHPAADGRKDDSLLDDHRADAGLVGPSCKTVPALSAGVTGGTSPQMENITHHHHNDHSHPQALPSHSRGEQIRILVPGDSFGVFSFFTETPNLESVITLELSSILVISREGWERVERDYPMAASKMLMNLQQGCEDQVVRELRKMGLGPGVLNDTATMDLVYKFGYKSEASLEGTPLAGITPHQRKIISATVHVRNNVKQFISKVAEARITEFLAAAARSDAASIKQMLLNGHNVNGADYDDRTALMVAANKSTSDDILMILLKAGADPDLKDNTGSTALLDACKCGNDVAIDMLCKRTSLKKVDSTIIVSLLCQSVYVGDTPLLRRLIRSGADVTVGDWDSRTALHIAASEGNIAAVMVLLESSTAGIDLKDRWGNTPLLDARESGARHVIEYLEKVLKREKELNDGADADVALAALRRDDVLEGSRSRLGLLSQQQRRRPATSSAAAAAAAAAPSGRPSLSLWHQPPAAASLAMMRGTRGLPSSAAASPNAAGHVGARKDVAALGPTKDVAALGPAKDNPSGLLAAPRLEQEELLDCGGSSQQIEVLEQLTTGNIDTYHGLVSVFKAPSTDHPSRSDASAARRNTSRVTFIANAAASAEYNQQAAASAEYNQQAAGNLSTSVISSPHHNPASTMGPTTSLPQFHQQSTSAADDHYGGDDGRGMTEASHPVLLSVRSTPFITPERAVSSTSITSTPHDLLLPVLSPESLQVGGDCPEEGLTIQTTREEDKEKDFEHVTPIINIHGIKMANSSDLEEELDDY